MSNSIIDNERDKELTPREQLNIRELFKSDPLHDNSLLDYHKWQREDMSRSIERSIQGEMWLIERRIATEEAENKPWYIKLKNFLLS